MKEELDFSGRRGITFVFATAIFIGSLVLSSITASKLYDWNLFGLLLTVPVGTSLFALTFLSTDVIGEVFGKHWAKMVVFAGLVVRVIVALFLLFAVGVEANDAGVDPEAFEKVMMGTWRVVVAGVLVYPVSQMADVLIFHKLKDRGKGNNPLWQRNILSTAGAQTIDSLLFVAVAFLGELPWAVLVSTFIGQVIVKTLISLLDTPFVYLLRNWTTERELLDFGG